MTQRPDAFNDQVIGTIPKNNAAEQRMTLKRVTNRGTSDLKAFLEIREYWYKNGPMNEPIPTKKGVLIHRDKIPLALVYLLRALPDGEFAGNDLAEELVSLMRRATSGMDPVEIAVAMLKSMSAEDVDQVIASI